jgi:hypothetical protein
MSTGSDVSTSELFSGRVNGVSTVIALTVEIGSHYYPQRLRIGLPIVADDGRLHLGTRWAKTRGKSFEDMR